MNLLMWQVVFTVSIFVTIIFCCLLPPIILRAVGSGASSDSALQNRLFGWLNCLTGGIFLAICFLSLLPNVQQHFIQAVNPDHEHANLVTSFPIAECVILIGFFLILTVEQLSRQCVRTKHEPRVKSRLVEMDALLQNGFDNSSDDRRTLLDNEDDDQDLETEVTHYNYEESHHSHAHHDHAMQLLKTSTKGLKFLVLLCAVVAHAFFEGIVLGLQDDFQKAIRLFVAILVHEAVVAAILGFNMTKTKQGISTALGYSLIFAVTIPIGIWVGIAVGQTPGSLGHYVSGTVQGVAAGMFLHITFMQLLPDEFAEVQHYDGLFKTLFMFIGFLLLLILNAAMGGHH